MNEDMFVVRACLEDGGVEEFVELSKGDMYTRVEELVVWGYPANGIEVYKLIPYDEAIEVSVLVNKRLSK